jgi:hypothetical protein
MKPHAGEALLAPWSFEKLIVAQLVKKFFVIYAIESFMTVITRSRR